MHDIPLPSILTKCDQCSCFYHYKQPPRQLKTGTGSVIVEFLAPSCESYLQRPPLAILPANIPLGDVRSGAQVDGVPGDARAGADGDVAEQGHLGERAGVIEVAHGS